MLEVSRVGGCYHIRKFKVVRETRCFYWLQELFTFAGGIPYIRRMGKKKRYPFAWDNLHDARVSYAERKRCQIRALENKLSYAKIRRASMLEELHQEPKVSDE